MLRGIRKASANWLGKSILAVVVAFLVVSFAIWGIGDIFRGFGRSTVAKVGGTEISVEQFRQHYTERLQQIGRQLGRPITLDQARTLGLDQQILGQMIAEMTLDERARALRLEVADAEIVRRIKDDPSFQGPTGQFSQVAFEQLLRQAGYNEQRYVAEQRRHMIRRQLGGTVTTGSVMPKAYVEAAHRYQSEERSIEYVLLDRAQAGDVPAPTPEALAKYFEERKVMFRAPEYRKIVIVAMLPGEQALWMEIPDADLRRAYEERRARFGTPERRQIQQIVFPNAEEARAAAERLAQGTSFEEIAKQRGLSEKDIDLGMLAKSSIIDRTIADAAFALKEGEVSAPLQGRFGSALVKVLKIEPEQIRSFEEVAGDLRKELAAEKAKAEMLSVYDKIEDERSLGRTLAEAAENLKLAARTIEVDRSGRDMAGNPVGKIPDAQRLLQAAFTADPGVENDPLQVEGGYVWYEVSGVTPARDRTLEEVKDQVQARWREDEVETRLKARASQMLEKLKAGGTSLADMAAADKLKVGTATGIKRGQATPPLSSSAVDVVFRTPKGAFASAAAEQPAEQLVLRVTEAVVPPFDPASDDIKRVEEALSRSYSDNVFGEYIAQLEKEIGVTINQAALRQVVTGASADR